jgi:hypothetical protein
LYDSFETDKCRRTATRKTALGIAARYGHRNTIDLLLAAEAEAVIRPSILGEALSHYVDGTSYKVKTVIRPASRTVRPLLEKGVVLDESILNTFEQHASKVLRCKYHRTHHAQITDAAMTLVLIGTEIKKQLTRAAYSKVPTLKAVVNLVATGKIKVPTAPLPFRDMAQELCDWSVASV